MARVLTNRHNEFNLYQSANEYETICVIRVLAKQFIDMNNNQQKKYGELIENELSKVEAELKTVGRKNPDSPGDWEPIPEKMDIQVSDDNEVADSIEAFEENTAILKQLEIRYNELKDALKRIADGKFGTCEVCGEVIESERLDANLAAKTCKLHMK